MITKFKIFKMNSENFQIYENSENNLFNIDDYVLLIEDYFHSYERDASECRGIIIDAYYDKDNRWEYDIVLVNGEYEQGVLEHGIERLLTPEEIEQIKIEEETNKYNL